MNVITISPHFPPNFVNFSVQLKNAGANVIGVGDAPHNEIPDELKESLTEYCSLDLHDYDKVFRTVAYLSSKYGKIDRIDSHSEHWLRLEADLREDFNIFGQKPKDLDRNQSKLAMKEVYNKIGVPCCDAIPIENPDEVYDFVQKHGYPLVIKPDKGVGAANTYKIENEKDFWEVIESLPNGYIIEPFIEGDIVTFDGLADKVGDIMFCASFELNNGVMESLHEKGNVHYFYTKDLSPELEKLGRKVVKGFNLKERFFHCEFFRTPSGQLIALEINVRPPGGYSLDMLNFTSDIDLYKAWAKLLVNGIDTLDYQRKYNVGFVARRDHINYKHSDDEVYKNFGNLIASQKRLPKAFADAMGDECFIIRHTEFEPLIEAVKYIEEKAVE